MCNWKPDIEGMTFYVTNQPVRLGSMPRNILFLFMSRYTFKNLGKYEAVNYKGCKN